MKDTWPIWLAIIGIAFAFAVAWPLSTTLSAAVRYMGMILQLLGLIVVALGLVNMRRLFGRPSPTTRVFDWFGRLAAAFTGPKSIVLQGSGISELKGAGRLVLYGVRLGASVEQRLSALEKNMDDLRREFDTMVQGLQQELATLNERIQRESQERHAGEQELRRTIEEVAIGGLHLETVGLFWLVFGVVGASIPDEIAAWLSLAVQVSRLTSG